MPILGGYIMRMPCEMLQEPYIVTVRKTIARELQKHGWTQANIAAILQVTQPVVSSYLKDKQIKENNETEIQVITLGQKVGVEITELFLTYGDAALNEAIMKTCRDCKLLRSMGPMCSLHFAHAPQLREQEVCTACHSSDELIQLEQPQRYEVIHELHLAVKRLNSIENIAKLVPEIGLQMVYATPDFSTGLDVAGFPGRIGKYQGKLVRLTPPEFGASTHSSNLLMEVHRINSNILCVIGLKNSSWFVKGIEELGVEIHELNIDQLSSEQLEQALEKIKVSSEVFALVGEDGVGIEGISYIFAPEPQMITLLLEKFVSNHVL